MSDIQIKYIDDPLIPTRGSEDAAGYDITVTTAPKIVGEKSNVNAPSPIIGEIWNSIDYIEYETNIFIAPLEKDIHTIILPRSSLSKYNLLLANSVGLIDNDYRGMVKFRFKYVFQPKDFLIHENKIVGSIDYNKIYNKGDKVGQFLAQKTIPINFISVPELNTTVRNTGGFGSTDKPTNSTLSELYKKYGGISTKKPYSEEVKERTNEIGR